MCLPLPHGRGSDRASSEMEKDPEAVARLAKEKEDENWRFRSFVKHLSIRRQRELDRLAEQFGGEAAAQIDCQTCAACCRSCHVPIDDAETERLAGRLSLPVLEFRQRHMEPDDDREPALRRRACSGWEPLLGVRRPAGGLPGLSLHRRRDRAAHDRDHRARRECPIVFEMLERLKAAVGFDRFR